MAMMTFTRQNVHQALKKSPMRGGKSDAGGPEKQLIYLCGLNTHLFIKIRKFNESNTSLGLEVLSRRKHIPGILSTPRVSKASVIHTL